MTGKEHAKYQMQILQISCSGKCHCADACLSWSLPSLTEQQVPPQASYAALAEESQAFFKCSPHTKSISNSAILHNNYISLLSDLCACYTWRKNSFVKEAIVLQWVVRIASHDFKPGKKRWASTLLSEKCCFVHKPSWKSRKFELARLKKKNILAVWCLSGSVPLRCFLAPLGVFHHENTRRWTV